ncbi:MAG: hypothetical protein AAGI03_15165 [Pseudomonadota bacterium]
MKVSWKAVVAVGLALAFLYGVNFFYAVLSEQEGGTFGDTFGAVNALFSGSALFFLVLAFISQREELELVRQERDDTRKLLEGQEEINKQQRRALEQQLFEQAFYSHLNIVLQERERLSRKEFQDSDKSFLDNAHYSSRFILNSLRPDSDHGFTSQNRSAANRAYFYLNAIVDLKSIIDRASSLGFDTLPYFDTIYSMLGENECTIMVYFAVADDISQTNRDRFRDFIAALKDASGLPSEASRFSKEFLVIHP